MSVLILDRTVTVICVVVCDLNVCKSFFSRVESGGRREKSWRQRFASVVKASTYSL